MTAPEERIAYDRINTLRRLLRDNEDPSCTRYGFLALVEAARLQGLLSDIEAVEVTPSADSFVVTAEPLDALAVLVEEYAACSTHRDNLLRQQRALLVTNKTLAQQLRETRAALTAARNRD